MKRRFRSRICAAMLSVAVSIPALFSASTSAYTGDTGYNGYHVNYYCSSSNLLIIGDSRTCQLYYYLADQPASAGYAASYNATWGGNYGSGSYQIDTSAKRAEMAALAQQILAAQGSCRILINGSINDATSGTIQPSCIRSLLDYLRASVGTTNVSYYVASVVPGGSIPASGVATTNTKLQSMVSNYAATYPDTKISYYDNSAVASSAGVYQSDSLHFTMTGAMLYFPKFKEMVDFFPTTIEPTTQSESKPKKKKVKVKKPAGAWSAYTGQPLASVGFTSHPPYYSLESV